MCTTSEVFKDTIIALERDLGYNKRDALSREYQESERERKTESSNN